MRVPFFRAADAPDQLRWRRRFGLVVVLVLLLGGISVISQLQAEDADPASLVREADRHFDEKSFAKAAEAYDKALKAGGDSFRMRNHCRWRLAECHMADQVESVEFPAYFFG